MSASSKTSGGKFAKRICNLVPSRGTESDWTIETARAAGAAKAPAAPPPAVDLRQSWWTVNDQGSTGACVGWATADGVVRYHMVKAGRLPQATLLSPRFVWMASKETDAFVSRPETFVEEAGTQLKTAMDIVRKFGVVPDSLLPFKVWPLMYTGDPDAFYATAATRKAASYFNLGRDIAAWKSWIAGHGPILAGLNVDRTWDNAASTGGKLDVFVPSSVRGGHAICIVGYTADRIIIRNSWGKTWGDKGFGYASAGYINAAFFTESYGVTI